MKPVKLVLVVVVLILGLLIFIFLFNPSEHARQKRDQQRVNDLETLKKALDFYLTKNAKAGTETVKLLCQDCKVGTDVFAFREGAGVTVVKSSRFVNGTGWLPVDFSANMKLGETPVQLLPVDPLETSYSIRNNFPLLNFFYADSQDFVYTFTPGKDGKYKLTARMESSSGLEKAKGDNGTIDTRLEIGSDLKLEP